MNDEGLADAAAANPFRLPRLHPGIGFAESRRESTFCIPHGLSAIGSTMVDPTRGSRSTGFNARTGSNAGLGECSPVREDQVVVDLGKRMNNVLEIDEMLGSPLPNGDRDELECR
jgi:hypothetical protein